MIVDAKGQVLGRMSSFVAKKALLGESVIVINAESALISGRKEAIFQQNLDKLEIRNKGDMTKGPFHQKRPDKFVRKVIRGMLPWKKTRGREAYKRVMVYVGSPREEILKKHGVDINKEKAEKIESKRKGLNGYATVGEVCRFIGGKW